MLKVLFDSEKSQFDALDIKIDGHKVDYTVDGRIIDIKAPEPFGLYEMKLSIAEGQRLEIVDVFINDCSARQMLFFSFMSQGDKIFQPITALWEKDQTWVFRYGLPFSHWQNLLLKKFPNGDLGTNLLEKYDIYWPEKAQIADTHPTLLKDYFANNFDFSAIEKTDRSKIVRPYTIIDNLEVPESVLKELQENVDYLRQIQTVPQQHQYNAKDDSKFDKNTAWVVTWLHKSNHNRVVAAEEHLPETFKFIDSLGLDIFYAFIGVLDPGQYVAPHVDRQANIPDRYVGCTQIYVPLNCFGPKVHFKFADVGLVPMRPCVINTQRYTHALINDNDEQRFALAIVCDVVKVREKFNIDLAD
jgi:hypothetical protein